jgi:multicomponent Na+:H+ antiporter subunit D
MTPERDIRLLLALLAPLIGAGLVMATGRRPNLREGCSFVAAVVLFGITVSLVPDIRAGHVLTFRCSNCCPGLSVTLRADAMSMLFAVSASFLWILTVFYSAGYMRGLQEHAQTRFNACFALALFGAIGCAFADNLLTLYLFYEIVSVCTYPLVAHHQDAEGYEGGLKYLIYLTTTAKALVLPAMVMVYVLNGNLDFARNIQDGVLPATAGDGLVTVLYVCFPARVRQERHHAVPPLAAGRDGGADPGQRAAARGGGGEGRGVLHRPRDALRVRGGTDGRG